MSNVKDAKFAGPHFVSPSGRIRYGCTRGQQSAATIMRSMWKPPSALRRKQILDSTKSIAVVGASANAARPSNQVLSYLMSSVCDYDLYPVNPNEETILGLTVYPSLVALPIVPDMVDVFRKANYCPGVAQEAVDVGAKSLWLQLGIVSDEAAAIAFNAGLDVVMDRCTKIEHARFAESRPPAD